MVNLERELKVALRTGKLVIGSKEVMKLIGKGKGKMIIIESNCPELIKEQVEYYAKLSGIPVYYAPYTSKELGEMCQRGHMVASLVVLDEGDSEILKLIE
ncbi:MAG: 50S ribosomal protein L30e [Candidatus Nezhaarchaeales archaeon]